MYGEDDNGLESRELAAERICSSRVNLEVVSHLQMGPGPGPGP